MFFKHKEDVDFEGKVDAEKLDYLLRVVINRTANAIRECTSLPIESRSLLAMQLQAFLSTHRSIRVLIGRYETEFGLGTDAMSLAREQVEKIFAASLIIADPPKWTQAHIKSNWKKMYERHLLSKEELQGLPRCQKFINEDSTQLIEIGQQMAGITADEKSAVEFRFYNPGKKLPANLKLIEDFPTPGNARNKVSDPSQKRFLDRWYTEYKMLCGYSHIGIEKLMMQALENRLFHASDEKKKLYFEKEILQALTISYTAAASTCAEAYKMIAPNIEVVGELTTLWKEIENLSLLGKVFWNIRAKELLPCL